ncbi:tRNA (guanine(26)-N(2))-dimethyltransferase [Linum grandiflorum]
MLSLFNYKTLSPPYAAGNPRSRISSPAKDGKNYKLNCCNPHQQTERGIKFETGGAFYRHESSTGRDLGVLATSLHKQSEGGLRVLDVMYGCGIRSCRYLIEAGVNFVMANDANEEYREVIVANLKQVDDNGDDKGLWIVCHSKATRILTECYLWRDYFDLIDVDSFGSDSMFLRSAILALRFGGLLYLTSTDGYSSVGGHRPQHSLDAYGAYVHPMPFPNEIDLRVLIGGTVREAAVLGYHVTPLFSYFAFHGPVYRVMLQLNRDKLHENRDYGFIGYCNQCGHSQTFSWKELGKIGCSCCSSQQPSIVSRPMWIGPLHSTDYVTEMSNLATELGWVGNGEGANLEKLLNRMIDESNPRLPLGYIKLDEMTSRAKIDCPPLKSLMSNLHTVRSTFLS